jgi:hypothetical protein
MTEIFNAYCQKCPLVDSQFSTITANNTTYSVECITQAASFDPEKPSAIDQTLKAHPTLFHASGKCPRANGHYRVFRQNSFPASTA